MQGFITPPDRIPLLLRLGIWIAEKTTGKEMLPARLLSWLPKAAVGSGILEALVVHRDKTVSRRLLKLVRLQTSFTVSCPFCIDMNGADFRDCGISDEEIEVLRGVRSTDAVDSLDNREKTALEYSRLLSQTPIRIPPAFVRQLKSVFDDREIVVLGTTVAQVNYWARLIQSMGIPPAGFSEHCPVLSLNDYQTQPEQPPLKGAS